MINVWHIKDYGGTHLYHLVNNRRDIPEPLPWIDPSINCLYREAACSYLVGNYYASLTSLCQLLEHTLRAALLNDNDSGLGRDDTDSMLYKFKSLSEIIKEVEDHKARMIKGGDMEWWKAVARILRNKAAHYTLPTLIRKCAEEPKLRKYISEYELPEKSEDWYYKQIITDWGSFYHKAGRTLTKDFLQDVTKELKILIKNTSWRGDESWWKSLKDEYERFFDYKWSRDNLKDSFDNAYGISEKQGSNLYGVQND